MYQNQTQTPTLRPSPDALLNPRLDPIFKSLFTNNSEEGRLALTSFLSAILGDTVCDVEIGQNELPVESERDKQAIFDITCRIKDKDKVLNVEMQGRDNVNSFDNRSEYHVAHLLNHFVTKGTPWDKVPEAYMISVLNFVYEDTIEDSFLAYSMRLETGLLLKSSRMKIIYLELPKIRKLPDYPISKLTHSQRWGKFLVYADDKTKQEYLKLLAEEEAGIMYAQTVLNTISQSDAEWRRERDYIDIANTEATIRYEAEQKGYAAGEKRGYAAGEKQGFAAGEKRGIQQGIQQSSLNLAKKYMAMGHTAQEAADFTEIDVALLQ